MTSHAQSSREAERGGLRAVSWFGPTVFLGALVMMVVGIGVVGDPLAPETTVTKIGWFLIFSGFIAGVAGLLTSLLVVCVATRYAVLGRCGWGTVVWNAWPALSVALVVAGAEIYSLSQ